MKNFLLLFIFFTFLSCQKDEIAPLNSDDYYPPLIGNSWQTLMPSSLQWNESKIQPLYNYLEDKDTKGFMVLVDGKIVLEKYFNGHSKYAKWNWYSAAKTLTSITVGIAQQEGFLNISNKTSCYLGEHWTSLNLGKENLITIKNQLSMTTGLNDTNFTSINPVDLTYLADAGSRWAYHNGPYTLLQEEISQATNQDFKTYFSNKIQDKIGMNGTWNNFGNLHIYRSTLRDMARFGYLILKNGEWNDVKLINEAYFNEMISVSQNINKSYGYLWWLNGQDSFMLPTTQEVFNGSMIPNAPDDMIMALGANDQKIYVIPSKNMVVVRMGNSAGDSNYSLSSFDNTLWEKLNLIIQ